MRYTFADLIAAADAIDAVEQMKADLAEFMAENLHAVGDDGIIEFLDIATGDAQCAADRGHGLFQGQGTARYVQLCRHDRQGQRPGVHRRQDDGRRHAKTGAQQP